MDTTASTSIFLELATVAVLPVDFPEWKSIYNIFWRWRKSGLWKELKDKLREPVRKQAGKKPTPTAIGGEERAYESGKKVAGHKRHIAVDTRG